MTTQRLLAAPLLVAGLLGVAACGGGSDTASDDRGSTPASTGERAQVVVTYPVLAAVVDEVVGDAANVTVLMPNGSDPHEWGPSAKDIKTMLGADLVIDNGLGPSSSPGTSRWAGPASP